MNRRRRDAGFTLVEALIVVVIQAIVVGAVATAFMVFLRAQPGTTLRLDDARSTRGLQTWLSHDTMSTPHFSPPSAEGGLYVRPAGSSTDVGPNPCGAPVSTVEIVAMSWVQDGAGGNLDKYYADYRFEQADGEAQIVRFSCWSPNGGAVTGVSQHRVTTGVDLTTPPTARLWRVDPAAPPDLDPAAPNADPTNPAFPVAALILSIKARGGQTIEIVTASRNPTESF